MTHVEINGAPATVEDVHRAAMWNYGHFTSMQVRNRAVPGLSLHLRRLNEASAVLFPDAVPPSGDQVRTFIDHALANTSDASVRVTILPNPTTFPNDQPLTTLLRRVWQEATWEPIRTAR